MVVIFKDKEKKKIIKKFVTRERAEEFYNDKIKKSEDVFFEMLVENGFSCKHEIGLVGIGKHKSEPFYIRDELGRQVKVDLDSDDYTILKISNYKIEEKIYDFQTKNKIITQDFIKKYLKKTGIKLVSKLNNKIIVQNDDNFYMFTLKNSNDSERFIDVLSNKFREEKRGDCIFVKDVSTLQRKYLYDLLISKGFDRYYLFRHCTTHQP